MSGADAFAAADRPDLFADRVRYERILACRDVADWCRAQDGAGMTAADAFEAVADYCDWNAALNILDAAGLAESLNARGGDVRRRLASAGRDAIAREAGTHRTAMPH